MNRDAVKDTRKKSPHYQERPAYLGRFEQQETNKGKYGERVRTAINPTAISAEEIRRDSGKHRRRQELVEPGARRLLPVGRLLRECRRQSLPRGFLRRHAALVVSPASLLSLQPFQTPAIDPGVGQVDRSGPLDLRRRRDFRTQPVPDGVDERAGLSKLRVAFLDHDVVSEAAGPFD